MTFKSWLSHTKRPETYAWVFILLGLLAMTFLFIERVKPGVFHVFDVSDSGNLGSLLSGTAGIFWALAGVLLFFSALNYQREDLSLQRQELSETRAVMKEQSETLKIQTSEATFFRLLENHRSLIHSLTFTDGIGYDGLNKFYSRTKDLITRYYQAAHLNKVEPVAVSHCHPVILVRPQRENIEQIYFNVEQQILFIRSKLNDDTFYHQTLYNTLSKAEKYLLGLYCVNWRDKSIDVFNTSKFNYLAEFQGSGNSYFDATIPAFPALQFDFKQTGFTIFELENNRIETNQLAGIITVKNLEPGLTRNFKLIKIELAAFRGSRYEGSELTLDISVEDSFELNINQLLENSLFIAISKQRNKPDSGGIVRIPFDIVFLLEHKGTVYRYINHCNCQVSVNEGILGNVWLQVNSA